MNLLNMLQEFNPSKFIVYNCLLVFAMLFALRLDDTIRIGWFLVFTPLFLWKVLAIFGSSIAIYIWLINPTYRLSDHTYLHFKSMLISLSLQLLLLMFELLSCDKLESNRHFWIVAFIPLIFISLLSIAICFYAMKNDRSFELELFCSINVIQFIFIALRLDGFIRWSWFVVLVPLFVIMCLSLIGCLYALIFFLLLLRSQEVNVEQRKASLHTAVSYSLVVIPLLIFLFLLANKLDSISPLSHNTLQFNFVSSSSLNTFQQMSFFTVFIPLYISLVTLICLSFFSTGSRSTSSSWFGILLKSFPFMREYANISYNKQQVNITDNQLEIPKQVKPKTANVPVSPALTLDVPD